MLGKGREMGPVLDLVVVFIAEFNELHQVLFR
jgi:hypothetical protein